MPGKRAAVPGEVFTRRPSALDKLTGAATDDGTTVEPYHSDTVTSPDGATPERSHGITVRPSDRGTVPLSHSETAAPPAGGGSLKKTSFYLRADQLDKLDDLAFAYKKRTGRRIDRQDIVRLLIDRCTLGDLLAE